MVDFVNRWSELTEIAVVTFVLWLGISRSKFYNWRARYGMVNEHNGKIPRDFWIEDWERKAIIRFYHENPLEGYRRLTFMMLDQDVVSVSPATVWRVLNKEGLLRPWKPTPSKKGMMPPQRSSSITGIAGSGSRCVPKPLSGSLADRYGQ